MVSTRQETFFARVVELGLEDCIPTLKAKGWSTYARFAFGSEYNPQMSDPNILTKSLLEPAAGEKPDLVPMLRMLWWESWGIATADMKRIAEGGGTARKLGAPELKTRRDETLAKLNGLTITEELDVSDSLVQECVHIHDQNRLKYLPWEVCTSRPLEVAGTKVDQTWSKDNSGRLKCDDHETSPPADTSTDLMLDCTLKRRGLAMDMADLMGWQVHEQLRQDLMSAMMRPPLPGYERVSKTQVRRADEIAFTLLSKMCDGGVKREKGIRPLDLALPKVLAHRDYNTALQNLPASHPASTTGLKRTADRTEWTGESTRSQRRKINRAKGKGKGASGDATGGKGKSKGKNLPAELRKPGVVAWDEACGNICFGYNLNTCKNAPPGGKCNRGMHVCIDGSCRKHHPYLGNH